MKVHERSSERTVKPRGLTTNADRPLQVVHFPSRHNDKGHLNDAPVWLTPTGELRSLHQFVTTLYRMPPTLVASNSSAQLLAILDEHYGDRWVTHEPGWNFSVTPAERELYRPHLQGTGRRMCSNHLIVNWFGFGRVEDHKHRKARWHLMLDPVVFSDAPANDLPKGAHELLAWATEVKTFALEQTINVKPTQGATARQFLLSPHVYPKARRKVPRATNDKARPHIGINHYEVRALSSKRYNARYLDQRSAHHYHAEHENLPSSDYLYAYGSFREPGIILWKRDPARIKEFLGDFKGLICADITWQRRRNTPWIPHELARWKPDRPFWFFTNELDLLTSIGVEVTGIYAAWGGVHVDQGIKRYAKFAQALRIDDAPRWLKGLLLSAYGCLATRPRQQEIGYARTSSDNHEIYRTSGSRALLVSLVTSRRKSEPGVNNVIHRGMIEAATRVESLMYANYLHQHGIRTLAIYVDALIIEDNLDGIDDLGRPPPVSIPMFEPWRDKQTLTELQFLASNAFTSLQMTKTPGMPNRTLALLTSTGIGGATRIGTRQTMRQRHLDAIEQRAEAARRWYAQLA